MAVKTKFQVDEQTSEDAREAESLDLVYLDEMKQSGLSDELLAQFMDISKELSESKEES